MRLVTSIVVMKHENQGAPVIDAVLLVKHPEGCDPTRLINSALRENGAGQAAQIYPEMDSRDQATVNIPGIDWSEHQMHIQEAPSWFILDVQEGREQFQPNQHSIYEAMFKPYAMVN